MIRFEDILDKIESYKPGFDEELLQKRLHFLGHGAQGSGPPLRRALPDPPLNVAYVLADMKLDETSIAVGLLHDVIEDTLTTKEKIEELFGDDVAEIVEA
jgi:GTP diphosphokinase / guanosine-3',5'-bis(diphosphate) 3'-diphosphatase